MEHINEVVVIEGNQSKQRKFFSIEEYLKKQKNEG